MYIIDERDHDAICFVKAKQRGEPTFTLRAQDETAAQAVIYWLALNPQLSLERKKEVNEKIQAMIAWPCTRQAD